MSKKQYTVRLDEELQPHYDTYYRNLKTETALSNLSDNDAINSIIRKFFIAEGKITPEITQAEGVIS